MLISRMLECMLRLFILATELYPLESELEAPSIITSFSGKSSPSCSSYPLGCGSVILDRSYECRDGTEWWLVSLCLWSLESLKKC